MKLLFNIKKTNELFYFHRMNYVKNILFETETINLKFKYLNDTVHVNITV